MNPDYEQRSSAEVDRLLKELPELAAPTTLSPRVMNAIHRQASPARRWSWETWPRLWQAALLVALLALFGGLCLEASSLPHAPIVLAARHQVQTWATDVGAAWRIVITLLDAVALAVKHLGVRFLVIALTASGIAYAFCVGAGTFCVKYAFARRQN
jgi:hypothetical protein